MLRRLSRSQRHHPLRRAAKARRSLASAVADRRADGKNAFDPAATLHLTAAVFATRPPPASSAGSPRTRGALERPKHKDCRVSLGLARVVLRLGLEVAHRHDVRVRITSRARVKLGLHAPRPRLEEGLKNRQNGQPHEKIARCARRKERERGRVITAAATTPRRSPGESRVAQRYDFPGATPAARGKRCFCQNGGGRPALPPHQTRTARSPPEGAQNADAGGRKSPRSRARGRTDPTPPHERPAQPATNSRAEDRQEMSAAPRMVLVRSHHRPPSPSPRALQIFRPSAPL